MLDQQVLAQTYPEAAEEAHTVLLASAASRGDGEAFAELYELLSQRIFNMVLRSVHDRPTAEDICQEIWLRAHAEIRHLRAPEAVRTWLYRIASRACVDFSRSSRGKHRKDESDIDEFVVAIGPLPEQTAIVDSEVRMVWETLGAMAPRQSMALYLRQVEDLSYDEIAGVLECTRPTVEALLFRARQSFVREYQRVESSPAARCEMFSQVMAGIVDDEPTAMQKSALESHAAECAGCRSQLQITRRARRAYLALPLLPIGKGLALEALLAGGGATAGAGFVSTMAGLLGTGAFQAKAVFVGALITVAGGSVATGVVELPVVSETIGVHERAAGDAVALDTPGEASGAGSPAQALKPSPSLGLESLQAELADGSTSVIAAIVPAAATPAGVRDGGSTATEAPDTGGAAAGTAGGGTGQTGNGDTEGGAVDAGSGDSGPAGNMAATDTSGGSTASGGASGPPAVPGAPATATPGVLEQTLAGLSAVATGTLGDVGALLGETLYQAGVVAGDTLAAVTQPVATVIEPVDSVVEDLTGLSVNETLEDVLNLLPTSSATPVPLNETLADVLEPVGGLLEDPLRPVEVLLEDPLQPIEGLTGPLLGPLLPPTPTVAPQPTATPQPGAPPAPTPTATPEPGPCLLGLLFC